MRLNILVTGIFLSSSAAFSGFQSSVFSFDNEAEAAGLHSRLNGSGWHAQDVRREDVSFHEDLFHDSTVMAGFASGKSRPKEQTSWRLEHQWIPRFQQGHPHGGMTVFFNNDGLYTKRMGHVVAGGGEGEGVSEIAYSFLPDYWGKGFGSSIVGEIVHTWAPEVRRIGLGEGLDLQTDGHIISKFRCFGGQVLTRLDATASPTNPASWKILTKHGFKAAAFKVGKFEAVMDLDGQDVDLSSVETRLLSLHDASQVPLPLERGTRYQMIDTDGTVRTFSAHAKWDRIKFHFERAVDN